MLSTHKGIDRWRQAFTLIELLIVILIVSLVYYFGFSGAEFIKPKPKALTPLNLKSTIQNAKWFNGRTTLLCVDKCRSCYLRRDLHSPFRRYDNTVNLTGIIPYTIDGSNTLQKIEYGRFRDKPICLVMDFYENGSSTQLILEKDNDVYFLPAFFGDPKHFSSIEDAKEYWLKYDHLLSDKGSYY